MWIPPFAFVGREFDEAHKKVVHEPVKGTAGAGGRVTSAAATVAAKARLKDALWNAQPTTPKGEKRGHENQEGGGKKKKVKCWKCGEIGHYASQCPKSS